MTGLGRLQNECEQTGEVGRLKQSMSGPKGFGQQVLYVRTSRARPAFDGRLGLPIQSFMHSPPPSEIRLQPVAWD